MQCISPISIPRFGGKSNADRINVPCGRCICCLQNRARSWSFRLEQELKNSCSAYFVTLTYSDEYLPIDNSVNKSDLQNFFKLLRYYYSKKIKYYAVSEYGERLARPHYHAIIFGLPDYGVYELLEKSWKQGFIKIGTVTPASISYVTKYVIGKDQYPENTTPPFALMSKSLGNSYTTIHATLCTDENKFYVTKQGGIKQSLPRYYSDKIFSPVAREQNAARCAVLASKKSPNTIDEIRHSSLQKQELIRRKYAKKRQTIF